MMEKIAEDIPKILDRVNNMDKKVTRVEKKGDNIATEISDLKDNLEAYKKDSDEQMKVLGECVSTIEISKQFLSDQYDRNKHLSENLIKKSSQADKELQELRAYLKKLDHYVKQEKIARIEQAQYLRRNMVEISGIPRMADEKPVALITKMAQIAKFENFDASSIDVAHHISTKDEVPIIVLFTNRTAREDFYSQKRKLSAINVNQIMYEEEEGKYPDPEEQRDSSTFAFLNESLTNMDLGLLI